MNVSNGNVQNVLLFLIFIVGYLSLRYLADPMIDTDTVNIIAVVALVALVTYYLYKIFRRRAK